MKISSSALSVTIETEYKDYILFDDSNFLLYQCLKTKEVMMKIKMAVAAYVLMTFSQNLAARNSSDLYVFVTKHQGYTCERWGKKGYKDSAFEKAGLSFTSLDISRNTRKARINVSNTEGCEYTAYFNREKGSVSVTFDESVVSDEAACMDMSAYLDEFFAAGWNYQIKMNAYLSVEFPAGIESECSEVTGQSFARFKYDLLN